MSGFLAKALAIATLCCCPPESCAGFLSNWSAILTILATSSTLSDASFSIVGKHKTGRMQHYCIYQ